ncbi:MAG: DUF11 domain-containing protein, partial [Bacteroidetes bacterium]
MNHLRLTFFLGFALLLTYLPAQDFAPQARKYLQKQAKAYGLVATDLTDLRVQDQYRSQHNGLTHLYLSQYYEGLEIFNAQASLHYTAEGRLLKADSRLQARLSSRANAPAPGLNPAQALNAAAQHLGMPTASLPIETARPGGARQEVTFAGGNLSSEDIPVYLMYYPTEQGPIRLAWYVRIYPPDGEHWWNLWVDAQDGEVLGQLDWVVHCSFPENYLGEGCTETGAHVHSPFAPMAGLESMNVDDGTYNIFPFPIESPSHGNRALISAPADSLASPYGWHDVDGIPGGEFTITRGNNVYASEDRDADNNPGFSPDGGDSLLFDFPLDLTNPPQVSESAIITNLFYWNNVMHDFWYHYGFDEESGNFQDNTYGRGGAGGDPVFADAQDGSGTNNANFGTPPDGSNPRMQMYIWTSNATINYLTVNSPASIAGSYGGVQAGFGPDIPNTPLTEDLVLVQDGTGNNQGCNTLTNTVELAGKIAVIDRGGCTFVTKVQNAEAAGAAAVIVVNNQPGAPFSMGGGGGGGIGIPSIMISQSDGSLIKPQIPNGVNATLQGPGGLPGFSSSLDNGVIVHEYTHGISNRLTGGPANTSCLSNQEQAGEGWSDWYALVMTTDANAVGTTARGIGTYVSGEPTTGGGIRPYPYSTDMNVNPVTYDYIKTLSVPHGVGSVMCSMLWDLYWALVDEYGFDPDWKNGSGGNNMALQLVTDGLKLQACSPGFVDTRDGILLADEVNYGGANACLIWEVFARRGLGYSADQGSTNDRSDGIEAYDVSPDCQPILIMDKEADPVLTVQVGDTLHYSLEIVNRTPNDLQAVTVRDTLPAGMAYVPGSANVTTTDFGGFLLFNVGALPSSQAFTVTFAATLIDSAYTQYSFQDSLEDDTTNVYFISGNTGTDGWRRDSLDPRSGTFHFYVPNAPALNDQTLMTPSFMPDSATKFFFWHQYDTEANWDGGFVEILPTISQGAWIDADPYFLENGYNSVVGFNNPVGDRSVFGGNSRGYIRTLIDLSPFVGEAVFIRFRFVSDDNTNVDGWYIDDLGLIEGDEVLLFNEACVFSELGDSWCDAQAFPQQVVEFVADTTTTPGDTGTTALGLLTQLGVKVFPNPAQDMVTLRFEGGLPGGALLTLRNLHGQRVTQQ